jgi:hypothetical protein
MNEIARNAEFECESTQGIIWIPSRYHDRKFIAIFGVFFPNALWRIPRRIGLLGDDLRGALGGLPVIVANTNRKGVYDLVAWWKKIETELRKIQNNTSTVSRWEDIEGGDYHFGANLGYPPIESRIGKYYPVVSNIKRPRDIEERITAPHHRILELTNNVLSADGGEGEFLAFTRINDQPRACENDHE